MKPKYLTLIIMIACFIMMVSYCYAGNVVMIEGLIEKVTEDSIVVNGTYYDFTNVPVIDASGNNLSISELRIDRRVKLYFKERKITSILIQEYMLE